MQMGAAISPPSKLLDTAAVRFKDNWGLRVCEKKVLLTSKELLQFTKPVVLSALQSALGINALTATLAKAVEKSDHLQCHYVH